jgi:hypothetical protein
MLVALALEPGHAVPKAMPIDWKGLVEGQTDGYRLTVQPDAVDAVRFEPLMGPAHSAEGLRRHQARLCLGGRSPS